MGSASRIACMSGHSKWSSIKHKKGAADARRGQLFTKLARAIQVAARDGGGDPAGNAALATAVQKAKDARMPKDNIERAIAKGTGADSSGEAIEQVVYEGYGPGGVAIMVEALTDNRNRTSAEVRHVFTRNGGSLGEPGSVAWNFHKKGVLVVDAERYSEDDLVAAIDAGAEDLSVDADVYEVVTEPADLVPVRAALEQAGVELDSAELTMRADNRVPVEERDARGLLRLLDELEEQDDVAAVHANFDMDDAVLETAAA
jgi:YebC/PmpR family DNA-binding regulatory protein